MEDIKSIMDRIVADGVITQEEHDEFIEAVHRDGEIDEEESAQISRMFKMLQEGKLRIIGTEREKAEMMRKREEVHRKLQEAQDPE